MAEHDTTTDDDEGRGLGLLGLAIGVLTVITAAVFIVIVLAGNKSDEKSPSGEQLTAQETRGRQIFKESCSNCHTLAASGAPATVGPNLDDLNPPRALVIDAIENGRARGENNSMPADIVTGSDVEDVAAYVVKVAGDTG